MVRKVGRDTRESFLRGSILATEQDSSSNRMPGDDNSGLCTSALGLPFSSNLPGHRRTKSKVSNGVVVIYDIRL